MLNRRFFTFILVCVAAGIASAQQYFQQAVDYTISVTLDDKTNTLQGRIEMVYHNNSPNNLDSVYMHLWPNAYVNKKTRYAKQEVRNGSTKFQFAKKEDMGCIDGLSWTIDGTPVTAKSYMGEPDIVLLKLEKKIPQGGSVTIATPFRVDIPETFSRLGHVGESYQITQWYPKPAVYDAKGWHPIPYLDQGEFFSEFGTFDVTITLPKNYVVGATGTLETATEVAWLRSKVKESEKLLAESNHVTDISFPASSKEMKTIRYKAEKVHDFAWFADKRFYVQHKEVKLASGREVDAWAMFTDTDRALWRDSGVHYVARGVLKYSEVVGEYPYPHATAVQSALSAGAGMEYPMITVIGTSGSQKSLDEVIIHEVGHNWFYGILASNERDFPWMDEGFNTYVENRYMASFYPNEPNTMGLPKRILNGRDINFAQLSYRLLAERGYDIAPSTNSEKMDGANYGLMSYFKTGLMLKWLEMYLGTDLFDKALHEYYNLWKFKHPYPEDVKAVFERVTARDLSWFFDDQFTRSGYVNYEINAVKRDGDKYIVTLVSNGNAAAPLPINGVKNGKTVATIWAETGQRIDFSSSDYSNQDIIEGKVFAQNVTLPVGDYDEIVIDNDHITLDMWDNDNRFKLDSKSPKYEKVRFQFLGLIDRPERTTVYYSPYIIANGSDGFGIGMAFYNSIIPQKQLDWLIAPAFGFNSKKPIGKVAANWHLVTRKQTWLREITFSSEAQRFSAPGAYSDIRISPAVILQFRHGAASNRSSDLALRAYYIRPEKLKGFTNYFTTLRYTIKSTNKLYPNEFWAEYEGIGFTEDFFNPRLSAAFKQKIVFGKYLALQMRAYLTSIKKQDAVRAVYLSEGGWSDYKLDQYYFGRNGTRDRFWSRQVSPNSGSGMKLGNSMPMSNSVFTLSSDVAFHKYIPVKPYLDYGYDFSNDLSVWSSGIALDLDVFALYFPIASSKNIVMPEKYGQRITFALDLRRLQKSKFSRLITSMM